MSYSDFIGCLICCLSLVSVHTNAQISVEEREERITTYKYKEINSLDGYCTDGRCSGFRFDDTSEVADFNVKAQVHITDGATYDFVTPTYPNVFVFTNSTFAHFPMNLFTTFQIHELDIRNCSVASVAWENFAGAEHLQILLLSDNKLERIGSRTFSFAANLQYLFLANNRLSQLDELSFMGLFELRYLDLSGNQLYELADHIFEHVPNLQELHLTNNQLYRLSSEIFNANPKLLTVNLENNDLESLDENTFKSQTRLMSLIISHNNKLKELILTIEVRQLIAANCSLQRVNIYGSVYYVDMRDNTILELYFSQPEGLENLNLCNNSLEQIASLALATGLEVLDVSVNPNLLNLPEPWMTTSLQRLNLSDTGLKKLPIASLKPLTYLRSLDISHNKIRQIEPYNLVYLNNLTHFFIHNNDWNCYNLNLVMDVLILANGITYTPDKFEAEFPGEYKHGIACMYRLEETEENDSKQDYSVSEDGKLNTRTYDGQTDANQNLEELIDDPSEEVRKLRQEFKVVVNFYEMKLAKAFKMISDLDERLQKFERINAKIWKDITITV